MMGSALEIYSYMYLFVIRNMEVFSHIIFFTDGNGILIKGELEKGLDPDYLRIIWVFPP